MTQQGDKLFEAWSIYDRALSNNTMYHDEIFENVALLLRDHFDDRPISVLDLGCGSAKHIAQALAGQQVSRYVGYDLSQIALDHARENLAGLNCPLNLEIGDFHQCLRDYPEKADLIVCSFAMHHLSTEEKADFFQYVAEKLADDGMFLLIDTVRAEGEDREAYLSNYCTQLRSNWDCFSPEELDEVIEHIHNKDFPETAATLREMGAAAGLTQCEEHPYHTWHGTLCFERGSG